MVQTRSGHGLVGIELGRSERGNALSDELVAALQQALQAASAAPDTRLIALQGAGAHFSTGFDLSDLDTCSDADLLARFVRVELLLAEVWGCAVPVAAYAQGRTWGAGADLFCAARERWAHPATTFRFPGAQFGLVLGTRRLARRVGTDTARRWVETGASIDAAEALDAGLVTHIAEPEAFAGHVAQRPMRLDAVTRAAIYRASEPDAGLEEDLAHLVRSAIRPGLRQRIQAYRQSLKGKA